MQVEYWTIQNNALVRVFEVLDYDSAFDFADEIRMVADELDHHPEITINVTTVTVRSSTHSAGNVVTEKDVELATVLNQIYEEGLEEIDEDEIDDDSDESEVDEELDEDEEIDEEKSV